MWLFEMFTGDLIGIHHKIAYFSLIPGIILSILIRMKVKATAPPEWLVTLLAIIAFVQSICWIKTSADSIVDLLTLMQLMTGIPLSLFALTIIAWGNCLGDMSADVAMTKKGFGEMAIAGTMAGPIFNILMGQGLSLTIGILGKATKEVGIMDI